MADPKIVRDVRLENTTSRKAWYTITLEDHGGTYRVRVAFGKLGGNAIKDYRTGEMGYRFAEEYFARKLKEKTDGDYKIIRSSAPLGALPATPTPTSKLHPSHKWSRYRKKGGITGFMCTECDMKHDQPGAFAKCSAATPAVDPNALPATSLFKSTEEADEWAKLKEERVRHAPWGGGKRGN